LTPEGGSESGRGWATGPQLLIDPDLFPNLTLDRRTIRDEVSNAAIRHSRSAVTAQSKFGPRGSAADRISGARCSRIGQQTGRNTIANDQQLRDYGLNDVRNDLAQRRVRAPKTGRAAALISIAKLRYVNQPQS
jgi:hypothetical protein